MIATLFIVTHTVLHTSIKPYFYLYVVIDTNLNLVTIVETVDRITVKDLSSPWSPILDHHLLLLQPILHLFV